MSSDDHGSLVQLFLAEASTGLTRLWSVLHPSDGSVPAPQAVRAEYIAAHTLRGSASLYGLTEVAELAGRLEEELERIQAPAGEGWDRRVGGLRELVETLRRKIEAIGRPPQDDDPPPTDEYLLPEMDVEVFSYFAPEAQEYLDAMEAGLLRLEKKPDDPETIQELFRTAHTLKGSAYTVGFQSVGDLTHHVEDFLGAMRDGHGAMTPELADAILKMVDVVRVLMQRDPDNLVRAGEQYVAIRRRLRALAGGTVLEPAVPDTDQDALVTQLQAAEPAPESTERPEPASASSGPPKTADEATVIRVSRERLERLLNLVGELVISRGRLEQRLVALEQLSHQVLLYKSRMVDTVRGFEEKHAFTFSPAPRGDEPPGELVGEFSSLEFDKYDDFNILARQIAEVSTDVGESMSQLNGSIRRAREDMAQVQRLTLGMRDEIARARMVPIGTPFTRFRRAIREMAKASGKDVTLNVAGETTEVDTVLVERLVDPLIHLVRNAVFHGIEPPAVRAACGKPATGTVYLTASHRGNAVMIEVEDDGGGLELDKIRAKAVARGLARAELVRTLSDAEVAKFIFLPGFTTAEGVGDQAGRGIGLDVVKRAVEDMNGQIEVESETGVGTKFTLTLPLTLLISMALLVRVGTHRYAVPLPSIREVILPRAGMVQEVGARPMLQVGEEAVEVRALAHLLGVEPTAGGPQPVIIVRTATGLFGLAVDELLGRQEIVIKGLGELKPLHESCFGGATIDPEGHVVLVLDVGRLLGGPRRAALPDTATALLPDPPAETERSAGATEPVRILLIDDSLSVRKFVGRMLERAGYAVDTAVDGEEGLRRAATHDYKLIITDLEMPKLNGYEVITALRDRTETKTVPILVMTTRAGEKHRRMALSIGASAYIAKPVEERALVQEVERWMGCIR